MGMNGSNFKNETLFVSFMAIIPPEMGEMAAQTFISEIEWLAALKRSCNRLVPYGTKLFSKSVR